MVQDGGMDGDGGFSHDGAFFRRTVESLPAHMRYFDGRVPAHVPHGSPWKHASMTRVVGTHEIAPGIRVVSNISPGPSFTETPELSLVVDTPSGQVLVVGCSHPGIERILESLPATGAPLRAIVGGLHWVTIPNDEIERLVAALRERWGTASIAPGHCTGEAGFAALHRTFGQRYVYAGVGSTIDLP